MPLVIIVGIVCMTLMAIFGPDRNSDSDAMKVCQLSHSYDVCFQALNR